MSDDPKRKCFMQDESSHWYCIPVNAKGDFELTLANEEYDTFINLFGRMRLEMHPSNYSFVDLKKMP